jgi:YaaC-like Protein
MARIITTENPSVDVRRFLRHWADKSFVDDRLREQHSGLNTDRRRTKSRQIARLVLQGLEFLNSADSSTVLTKPLTMFYGAENLARAACICRDVNLTADGLRAHGLGGERDIQRNSIRNLACKVQHPGKDVWSHVYRSLSCDRYRLKHHVSGGAAQVMDYHNPYANPSLRPPKELSFGELLRHLPETADDVELAGWGVSYMVRADSMFIRTSHGAEEKQVLNFDLRHGRRPKVIELIDARENSLLRKCTSNAEVLDVYEYSASLPVPVPTIRPDVFGELYMDLSPERNTMGEVPTYLAALFILSDVVRYQADNWLRLLADHPAEEIVVDRFLDLAGRKFPNLILNELHKEISEFKLAR